MVVKLFMKHQCILILISYLISILLSNMQIYRHVEGIDGVSLTQQIAKVKPTNESYKSGSITSQRMGESNQKGRGICISDGLLDEAPHKKWERERERESARVHTITQYNQDIRVCLRGNFGGIPHLSKQRRYGRTSLTQQQKDHHIVVEF